MTISPLAQMPQAIPLLASWMHNQWQTFDDRSVAMIERQLTENLHPDRIPITFIAHRDGDLLGTISLDISDLDGFDHLSPWLASLYVLPAARLAGIGSALVRHVQQFASLHGVTTMYLWTLGDARFYETFGWTVLERTIHRSKPITIMQFRHENT